MSLTLEQRTRRLEVRLNELTFWSDRAYLDLDGWTFDGRPWTTGAPWPSREGLAVIAHPAVAVPDDWPLEDTRLDLNLGGEGLLRIRSADGTQESWGLDAFHRRFPLRSSTFWLKAEVVPRLPFGVPNRDARLERARLVLQEPDVVRLLHQLGLVVDACRALSSDEVAEPLLRAGERALESILWPSETYTYLSRTAASPLMRQIWEAPRGLDPHPPGLSEEQRRAVAAAAEALCQDVARLASRYPPRGALALSGQAHLDTAWLWPMQETRRKGQRTSHTVIGLMDRYPELIYHLTAAQLYAFLEEDDPALFRRIQEKVEEGRWEPLGGMWVEPDLNMPAGESLVRQLLYGQRYFRSRFGSTHRVAWLPDCFGFSPSLPQLLLGAGIENFFTTKLNWSETNTFPYDLFWWEGLDGSRVLAHTFENPAPFPPGEPGLGGYNGRPDPISIAHTWRNYRGKHTFPESLLSIGYGDGGGGPTVEMLETVRALASFPALPALRFTSVQEFYDRVRQAIRGEDLPVWVGELYLELHRGTLTTQGRTKYLHRRAERELIAAEVLAAMNALLGSDEPASLEPQWQIVLRNEFHDILPGSSIREVYETTDAELLSVVEEAARRIDGELAGLAEQLVRSGERPALLVVNPDLSPRPLRLHLPHDFPGAQRVESGSVLAGPATVPPLGAYLMHSEGAQPEGPGPLEVSESRLENAFLRVTFADDGTLAGIYDKEAEREVLAGRGNQLWVYVDKPRNWDAWDVEEDYAHTGQELTDLESLEVLESGPYRAAVRVRRRFRNSSIRQDIRLWSNSARLEFETTLDWHDRRLLLKARFPLTVRAERASFECAFGVVQRPSRRNTSWEAVQFEVAGHRFADLSESGYGVALLNDGKYGHDALENELGLSLLRSPTFPDPYADEGEQTFTYALYPHRGGWLEGGVLMEAEDLNRPLLFHPVSAAEGSISWQALRLDGLPLGLGALKVLEDGGGLVLRAYEPQGGRGDVRLALPAGWSLTSELNLLEEPVGAPVTRFNPFQVHSWLLIPTP